MIRPFILGEISAYLDGELLAGATAEMKRQTVAATPITGISIDSRVVSAGELFVAIKGPRFDGHQYLAKAREAGAIAAVVDTVSEDVDMIQIRVSDTFLALGKLGRLNRNEFTGRVIAITGSCGKTSVKEMLLAILSEQTKVLSTFGNLNNGYGVPLTLFRIEKSHENAVIEIGTSSPGEIGYLSTLAMPSVAVITNAAEAHLAGLESVQGVAEEKGFILDSLDEDGIAVLNREDVFFPIWRERVLAVSGRKILSFSLGSVEADCVGLNIRSSDRGMSFDLCAFDESIPVNLSFWGRHQVANACCAAIACLAVGVELATIVNGLEKARPFQRRGLRYTLSTVPGRQPVIVFDETYNANPKATLAAIDQLSDCPGESVMVFGDMLELGAVSEERHREIGRYAREQGIEYFAGLGVHAKLACDEFGEEGCHFESKVALINWVDSLINKTSGDALSILVKGSKGMEMLDVVRFLVGPEYKGEC